jgi:hypothetical protein
MSMAKNTMSYSDLFDLNIIELGSIAEEPLNSIANFNIEEILHSNDLEEHREELVEYILECQDLMPH